jgi:hypothetical protein
MATRHLIERLSERTDAVVERLRPPGRIFIMHAQNHLTVDEEAAKFREERGLTDRDFLIVRCSIPNATRPGETARDAYWRELREAGRPPPDGGDWGTSSTSLQTRSLDSSRSSRSPVPPPRRASHRQLTLSVEAAHTCTRRRRRSVRLAATAGGDGGEPCRQAAGRRRPPASLPTRSLCCRASRSR